MRSQRPVLIEWDKVEGAISYCVVIAGGGQLVYISECVVENRLWVRLPIRDECAVSVSAWDGQHESTPSDLMEVYVNQW